MKFRMFLVDFEALWFMYIEISLSFLSLNLWSFSINIYHFMFSQKFCFFFKVNRIPSRKK